LICINRASIKQNTLRILSLYFFILAVVLFVAGCDLFGNDSTEPSGNQGVEPEAETFTPISSGTLLPNGTLQDKLLVIAERTDKNVI
jgi:hypothetical protein